MQLRINWTNLGRSLQTDFTACNVSMSVLLLRPVGIYRKWARQTFSWLLVHIQHAALLSRCLSSCSSTRARFGFHGCSKHHWTYKAMKCGHSCEFIDWSFDGVSEGIRGEAGGGSGSIWSWDCYTKVRDKSNGGKEWLKKLTEWRRGWERMISAPHLCLLSLLRNNNENYRSELSLTRLEEYNIEKSCVRDPSGSRQTNRLSGRSLGSSPMHVALH